MGEMIDDGSQRQRAIEMALAVLLVLLLIALTFRVLLPFAGVLTYALILATATSEPFERLVEVLNGRRRLAAILFGTVATVILVLPLIYLSPSVAELVPAANRWLSSARSQGIPDLPAWIADLPLLGEKATAAWQELQREGLGVLEEYQPQVAAAGLWLLNLSLGLMGAVVEILFGIIVAAMVLAARPQTVQSTSAIAARLIGSAGPGLLDAASRAIRGVAIGVIGTALLEGFLAWGGFAIAGVPGAIALAAVTFFFAVIQIGPLLVWPPVAIWLVAEGQIGWAVFTAAWGIIALMGTDNIVKPILIARSGGLPLLVLFVGVIGGLAAWGFTGMFIGATTLAVLWRVLHAWIGTRTDKT
jgi:predicted PurR-regulated permease PerM